MTPHIAVLDDEPRMAQILGMLLRREGYEVHLYQRGEALMADLGEVPLDLVLTDLKMPRMDGLTVLKKVKAFDADLPVVLITAHATVATAIEAMKEGAFDYVEKPFDNDQACALVRRALEVTRLHRENRYLRAELKGRYSPGAIVATSPAMIEVLELARRAARSRATVFITGESGTGKEIVARSIHYHSDRVGAPFVAVNCKAFSESLLEDELFGHEKGAFTGADGARAGLFERADGGTLFLDEIGEIGEGFQGKLLRVLQEREVLRVGGQSARPVDVRVVAATNKDIEAEVKAGRFREDLYFRLAVIPVRVPPLRERPADILPLARHFLARWGDELGRQLTGWSDEVEAILKAHPWPGNVRELENVMERAAVLAPDPTISAADLLLGSAPTPSPAADTHLDLRAHLDKETARLITQALKATQGARAEAATLLGIERTTLYRLMKKHGISSGL